MGFWSDVWDIVTKPFEVVFDIIGEVISWFVDIPDLPDDLGDENKGTLLNKASNLAQIPVIYGQRKVGGTRVFVSTSGADNEYLYIVLVLCEGEIQEIGDVYLNDVISTDSRYSGLVTINKYLGTDSQTADSMLIGVNDWSANHRLRGVAYLSCRLKWDQDAFGSMPDITAIVKGRKVYDTRTSTTAYSTNPALCLRDYLTNSRYGKGLATSAIDDTLINTAADKCEEQVTPYTGGTAQNIFDCNAVLSTDATVLANVRVLLSGMRGLMPYSQGKYGLTVEDEGSSVFTFTEDHIVDGISIGGVKKKDKKNRVIVSFVNPDNNWQPDQIEYPKADSPDYTSYLAEDNGVELDQRLNLKTITNIYQAEDIAEIILKKSRNSISCSFTATSEALQVSVGDIVAVTHSTPAWTAKTFRVVKLSITAEGTVKVDLIEHQDSIYPWSSKTEKDDIPDTTLPDPYTVGIPTALSATEELYVTSTGSGAKLRANVTWNAPSDNFVDKYEMEYRESGGSWVFVVTTSVTSGQVNDLSAGSYDFRVRAVNTLGIRSAYVTSTTFVFAGLTTPPSAITGFTVRALDGSAHLQWDQPTDVDVIHGGYVRIRHTPMTSGVTWSHGSDIGEALAGTATNVVLPLLTGTYLAKAVDSSGNFSTSATSAVTTVPNILSFNAVSTITESPSFAGTKDDTTVSGSVLRLDGAPNFMLMENSDNIVTEDGAYQLETETANASIVDSYGEYYFANDLDLGAVYTSRLTSNVGASGFVVSDLIDDRADLIDTWANFDGEPSDAVTAQLQIRTTEDDPASSPTWTGWAQLVVGDYHARAFEFRLIFNSSDSSRNIDISTLSVTIDMPDRNERAQSVAIPSGGSSIVYTNAFKDSPMVGITAQNMATGDYWTLSSQSSTGFTINFYNSADVGIARNVNWIATGYGKAA